jgi:Sulfotransferase family
MGERVPLVYIQSAVHSGSTLLALQLARHAQVCTVGELSGTPYRARPGYQCSCGQELEQCSFWQSVSAAMAKRGFSYRATTAETDIRNAPNAYARRLLKPAHRGPLAELVRDLAMLLCPGGRSHIQHHQQLKAALVESVIECMGKPVLVDSSKSGVQLKYHLRNTRFDMKVLWLVRDGRGAASSLMRNARLAMREAAHHWRRRNQEAAAIVRRLDRSRWIQVRYEALCAEPDRTLSRLWQFIGVAPGSSESSSAAQHHVLGHRMRLTGATTIQLDEKWRTQLSARDLQIFETVAGPFNRALGYR